MQLPMKLMLRVFEHKGKLFETGFWLIALILLFFLPEGEGHYSLCPLNALGFLWCPGCGIGHALHHAMHFQFIESFKAHFFGLPALGIICFRIFSLSRRLYSLVIAEA